MVADVYVLVTCRGEEHLPLSLLVFDTIRVGFPTARLHVCDNFSDYGSVAIRERATAVGAKLTSMTSRIEHGDYIATTIREADGPLVFVDTDVIFWENCEDITLPEGKLYGGRFIPEIPADALSSARYPARIHPSLLFVPDPKTLRAALAPFHKKFWYFRPFQGFTAIGAASPVVWDTCASLYAALPDTAYSFGESELDRYDHLFAGTYPDLLEEMGTVPNISSRLRQAHAIALTGDRDTLRGMWKQQQIGKRQRELPSWTYWSGVLSNGSERFGFMYATFEAPGIPSFSHSAVLDLKTKRFFSEADKIAGSVPPVPKNAPWSATLAGEAHWSGKVGVSDFSLFVDGKWHFGLSGEFWYECEERPVKVGEGWRWISMRLNDGRSIMLYDRSDAARRYAMRTAGAWTAIDAQVTASKGPTYENGWTVSLGGETFAISPVAPGQEIVDGVRGLRYLEALCSVSLGNEQVGWAYVEIVPSVAPAVPTTRAIRSIPSEAEMHLRWAQNDKDAAFLIDCFGYATQLADDLVDLDRQGVLTVQGRAFVMSELLYTLLIKIPGNPFFRKHEAHFVPLFVNCLVTWEASNVWAESEKKETKMFAYVQREAAGRLVEYVAYLIGGFQWSKQVAREVHEYYHGANMVESFEQFEAECKEKRK